MLLKELSELGKFNKEKPLLSVCEWELYSTRAQYKINEKKKNNQII